MKKLAFVMALVLTIGTLAACGDTSDTTTEASKGGSASTPAAQSSQSTPSSTGGEDKPQPTEPAQSTSDKTSAPSTPAVELSYPAEDVIKLPNGKVGDTDLEGYDVWGAWTTTDDGKLVSESGSSMFVVTNDRMSAGKLTATFTSNGDSAQNDNGIVFGMEDNFDEDSFWYWEDPINTPRYYFLFISDAGTLYLAKVACGTAWTELAQSQVIIGYAHGGTVTVSVEFDGNGTIKCYANDELQFEYQDTNGPTGSRYGVRCEVTDVVYHNVVAEHAE